MEPWQVVFITLYGGLLAYLAFSQIQQGKTISSMSATLDHILEKQDRTDKKIDLFLKSEIDTLKELINKVGKNG